jgi:hypothetical protein
MACTWDTEICIPVSITDIDNNIDKIETNLGYYSNGNVCFTPSSAGVYYIITSVTDDCDAYDEDTTIITVEVGQPISLDCPDDTSVFICEPDTLCFPIGGIPNDAEISVFPPSAWYNADNSTICFFTNCVVEKDLKIVVANDCDTAACEFTVNVTMNSRPLVLLPPDKTITLCNIEEICVPVGIADADYNLADVTVWPEEAVYNPNNGRICFTPTGSGDYVIKAVATDACGVSDSDSTIITVNMNSAPVVVSAADFATELCDPTEICFQVDITDIDMNILSIEVLPSGTYNPGTGTVCFTPNASGIYELITIATDSCGIAAEDTTIITVAMNTPPIISIEPYTLVVVCDHNPICLPISISDIDNNIDTIIVTGANYTGEFVCLEDITPGIHEIIISVIDTCQAVTVDTAIIEIILNSPPVVVAADDSSVFQCTFEEICYDVAVSDPDNNILITSTNYGQYNSQTGQICFTPDDTGTYQIIITVVDDCQDVAADTTNITVTTGDVADIDCPVEPVYYSFCEPTTICHPITFAPVDAIISTIPDGIYSNGELCFLADTTGTYVIEVIADAECGADTCLFEFAVDVGETAQITCPTDTSIFRCGPETVCLPVTITPEDAIVCRYCGTLHF